MDFAVAQEYFNEGRVRELSLSEGGLRFLKLRSLSRKDLMRRLMDRNSITVEETDSRKWLRRLYESDISMSAIDETISYLYEAERSARRDAESELISDLYKVSSLDWGRLHRGGLEDSIVNNYVKKVTSFEAISEAIDGDLYNSTRAYVLYSWYNHWTSIIIEDVFNDHDRVLPAVGRVKQIDFFINDKPFDLKVTHFPQGYVDFRRKSMGLRHELTEMKRACRDLSIVYDESSKSALIGDLWQKLSDHPSPNAQDLIAELQGTREIILNQAVDDPKPLARWLYESQGGRRFNASNRLFLILVDKNNFLESWKLKRAKPLLSESIYEHLNNSVDRIGFELDFQWQGREFIAESDVIFVIKG